MKGKQEIPRNQQIVIKRPKTSTKSLYVRTKTSTNVVSMQWVY